LLSVLNVPALTLEKPQSKKVLKFSLFIIL
jgi:hypothetical protein